MKKIKNILYLLLATAALLSSCNHEEGGGDEPASAGMIVFSSQLEGTETDDGQVTRAAKIPLHELGIMDLTVYGINGNLGSDGTFTKKDLVFNNYVVWYTDNSAATTSTNTTGWEYVGNHTSTGGESTSSQRIKYWDYEQNCHYFWAVANASKGKFVTDTDAAAGYATFNSDGRVVTYTKQVTDANLTDADAFYYSDICCVDKNDYSKVVKLKFMPYMSKVRLGFYETIPDYVVSNLTIISATTNYVTSGNATLTYDYTNNMVTTNIELPIDTTTSHSFGAVQYKTFTEKAVDEDITNAVVNGISGGQYLSRSSDDPSYSLGKGEANGFYDNLLPYENRSQSLTLTCSYTLTNTSTGNVTQVDNAMVTVPKEYMQWKPGFSYTYLFKINDLTETISFVKVIQVAIKAWQTQQNVDHPVYNW